MNPELQNFIEKARLRHRTDEEIKQQLIAAGWDETEVNQVLEMNDVDLAIPKPPSHTIANSAHSVDPIQPISVVQNLTVKGFEYHMMFITLWLSAFALVWIINDFIYGAASTISTFPLTVLVVSLPVFLIMFMRLRRAEISNVNLRNDPSRRKSVQSTQSLAFIVLLVQSIGTLYALINHGSHVSLPKVLLSWLASVVIFGSIFAYYWKSTHKDRLAQH